MRRRAVLATTGAVLVLAAGGLAIAAGQDAPGAGPRQAAAPAGTADTLPPLPQQLRPKVVEPVAGAGGGAIAAAPVRDRGLHTPAPAPTGPASGAAKTGNGFAGGHGSVTRATALANGIAVPPLEAPEAVKQIIEAGNAIARTPYLWGGGHGKWLDTGYDCSGSVSFALAAAGYLSGPLTSGQLMSWGDPGPGHWVTIYAHSGHVFMEVAGIRFDTSASAVTGSRWANAGRSTAGFTPRHPVGL